jgi:hypothetical protein
MSARFDTAGNRNGSASLSQVTRTITLAQTWNPAVGKGKPFAAMTSGTSPKVRVGRRLAIPAGTPVASVANGSPVNEVG